MADCMLHVAGCRINQSVTGCVLDLSLMFSFDPSALLIIRCAIRQAARLIPELPIASVSVSDIANNNLFHWLYLLNWFDWFELKPLG